MFANDWAKAESSNGFFGQYKEASKILQYLKHEALSGQLNAAMTNYKEDKKIKSEARAKCDADLQNQLTSLVLSIKDTQQSIEPTDNTIGDQENGAVEGLVLLGQQASDI